MRITLVGVVAVCAILGAGLGAALFTSDEPLEHPLAVPLLVTSGVVLAVLASLLYLLHRADKHLRSILACLSRERPRAAHLRERVASGIPDKLLPSQIDEALHMRQRIEDALKGRRGRSYLAEIPPSPDFHSIDGASKQRHRLRFFLDRMIEAIDTAEKIATSDHRSLTGSGS